jgi:hypothetical protein
VINGRRSALAVVGLVTPAIATPETELVLLFDADGLLRKYKLRRG